VLGSYFVGVEFEVAHVLDALSDDFAITLTLFLPQLLSPLR